MQEEQTVTFQPMYEGHPLHWFTKLFVFYLLFVLVLLSIRAVQIGSALRKLRKIQRNPGCLPIARDALWGDGFLKAQSLKNLATLTFLLSMLNFTWATSDILSALSTEKTVNAAYILPTIGDTLVPLSLGLIVCIILFIGSTLFESALRRCQYAFSASAPDADLAASRLPQD